MSQLVLMIAEIDELDNPEKMREVWRRVMPEVEASNINQEEYLNELEGEVSEVGWEAMRRLIVEQWCLADRALVERYREAQAGALLGDGYEPLKVASRFGIVYLPRQICYRPGEDRHILPGNAGLPEHSGQVTTQGLQEWVCLLPQDMSFGTAERLLGWMTQDDETMSETQIRRWVCRHGQLIREAEQIEVEELEQRVNLDGLQAQLRAVEEPRRPITWTAELNQAVETALTQPDPQPPQGISSTDWERVMEARRTEPTQDVDTLRR